MKINIPVTDVEYAFMQSDSAVSRTDLQGRIVYVNEDFLRINGYSKNDLIGESVNILRHPDMPAEAFADMWASLKADRPWTGLLKNRCKNGDYYWAVTNTRRFTSRGSARAICR